MTSKDTGFGIILICLSLLFLSSCISRLARPEIRGTILDYNRHPVAECKVGETLTSKDGTFRLSERRYNKFLLSEMMIMEAPPLRVNERIEKEGFESDEIYLFNPRGGGSSRGAKYNIDTIFLKRLDQQFDINTLLQEKTWNVAVTKNADTLYLIRSDFQKQCKTGKCQIFYNTYYGLTDNYLGGRNNLPEGIIRRSLQLRFKADHLIDYKGIQQYGNKNGSSSTTKVKETDSLETTGKWRFIIPDRVQIELKETPFTHTYKLAETDYYKLIFIKSDQ